MYSALLICVHENLLYDKTNHSPVTSFRYTRCVCSPFFSVPEWGKEMVGCMYAWLCTRAGHMLCNLLYSLQPPDVQSQGHLCKWDPTGSLCLYYLGNLNYIDQAYLAISSSHPWRTKLNSLSSDVLCVSNSMTSRETKQHGLHACWNQQAWQRALTELLPQYQFSTEKNQGEIKVSDFPGLVLQRPWQLRWRDFCHSTMRSTTSPGEPFTGPLTASPLPSYQASCNTQDVLCTAKAPSAIAYRLSASCTLSFAHVMQDSSTRDLMRVRTKGKTQWEAQIQPREWGHVQPS